MMFNKRTALPHLTLLALSAGLLTACIGGNDADESVSVPTLIGRSVIAADTYVAGPTSGQFINGGDLNTATGTYGYSLPFASKQPVQGFSALAKHSVKGVFYAMQDNGFGGKSASPDALLHIYALQPDWAGGGMRSVNFSTGEGAAFLDGSSYVRLADPDKKLGFKMVADQTGYPYKSYSPAGDASGIAVDSTIISKRYLTGADIDPESMVIDGEGNFWIGDEFGPWLIKVDKSGKVLQKEISVPNVLALDENPYVQTSNNPNVSKANLPGSGGFESMAINPSRTRIYTMLERELSSDFNKQRRVINVFDIASNSFLSNVWYQYKVGTGTYVNGSGVTVTEYYTVNDMVAVNDRQFLVLEKDRGAGDSRTGKYATSNVARVAAKFKKIYLIDLDKVDSEGFLVKTEVVDLMNIADPKSIGGADTISGVFTFPMESIESVHIVDANTIVVANDNNYPGGASSRNPLKVDGNEFIKVRLPDSLTLKLQQ